MSSTASSKSTTDGKETELKKEKKMLEEDDEFEDFPAEGATHNEPPRRC